jgi:hypothetical protein
VKIVLNVYEHDHVLWWPRRNTNSTYMNGLSYPELLPKIRLWADEYVPGYVVTNSTAANMIVEVTFASERDAVLFKTFWM